MLGPDLSSYFATIAVYETVQLMVGDPAIVGDITAMVIKVT